MKPLTGFPAHAFWWCCKQGRKEPSFPNRESLSAYPKTPCRRVSKTKIRLKSSSKRIRMAVFLFRFPSMELCSTPCRIELQKSSVRFLVSGWAFYPDALLTPEEIRDESHYMRYLSIGEQTNKTWWMDFEIGFCNLSHFSIPILVYPKQNKTWNTTSGSPCSSITFCIWSRRWLSPIGEPRKKPDTAFQYLVFYCRFLITYSPMEANRWLINSNAWIAFSKLCRLDV